MSEHVFVFRLLVVEVQGSKILDRSGSGHEDATRRLAEIDNSSELT